MQDVFRYKCTCTAYHRMLAIVASAAVFSDSIDHSRIEVNDFRCSL